MNINYFMNEALIEAEKAYNLNEIPIGAVLVDNKSNEIISKKFNQINKFNSCLLYTSPSPRDRTRSRMPSSA